MKMVVAPEVRLAIMDQPTQIARIAMREIEDVRQRHGVRRVMRDDNRRTGERPF